MAFVGGVAFAAAVARPADKQEKEWRFAISGDSRNCGDVVMPAIAADVEKQNAQFYWHLGDFRAIFMVDEDMQHEAQYRAHPLTKETYWPIAWDDFISNQMVPFGTKPVYLGIGNHETIAPKTRQEWILQFADWLEQPVLREQRLRDDPSNHRLTGYYHWTVQGVDFITMDNATPDQFDETQMSWFRTTLTRDERNSQIHTIVVGMHEALPNSVSASHSMNQSAVGTESGSRVYVDLLHARDVAHKNVYVMASHSHFYAEDIFNTDFWRTHGGVLPGWIVGTAGAHRYALPSEALTGHAAQTDVYGYLLARVHPDGKMEFEFHKLEEPAVPSSVVERFSKPLVDWCFAANSDSHPQPSPNATP
jgi:Calcineurin-like phosphoesterase